MKKIVCLVIFSLFFAVTAMAIENDPKAQALIDESFARSRAGIVDEEVIMSVTVSNWDRKPIRKLILKQYSLFGEGDDRVSIVFNPSETKMQIWQSQEEVKRIAIRFLGRGPVRLVATNREDRFLEKTDVTIRDASQMSREMSNYYNWSFEKSGDFSVESDVAGKLSSDLVLVAKPKQNKDFSYFYTQRVFWINPESKVINFVQYWNQKGVEKEQLNAEISFYGPEKAWRVDRMIIVNYNPGRKTISDFKTESRGINQNLSPTIFGDGFFAN